MLQDVASRCPPFRYNKDEVRNVLREVAEFKAPGVYVLSEYLQKYELPALQQKYGEQRVSSKPSNAMKLIAAQPF